MNETLMESTNSGSLRGGPFVACAALWPRPAAMMSNRVPSMTSAACVQGHTKRNVDTQPTTVLNTVTVTRDPHEEEFDIGPQTDATSVKQLHNIQGSELRWCKLVVREVR